MKKNLLFFVMIAVLACGCKDEKNSGDSENQKKDLVEALAGNYWIERVYFVQRVNGAEQVSGESLIALKYAGIYAKPTTHGLSLFYVSADGGIDKYWTEDGSMADMRVRRGAYTVGREAQVDQIRLETGMKDYLSKGWFVGMTLQVQAMSENEISLNVGINDYIRREWAKWIDANTTAIRVVWTMISEADIQAGAYGNIGNATEDFVN